tara:strand:- start:999 stop:1454 length:456 start_codon:yes stop_codon:yes gene_type:complete
MRAVKTQSISAFEANSPVQKNTESNEDFDVRKTTWQKVVDDLGDTRTVGMESKVADLQSQLDKVDNDVRRIDGVYQNGIDLSTSSPSVIPKAWNKRRHSMYSDLAFGDAPLEWGGGRAPAKASAKAPAKTPAATDTPASTNTGGLGGLTPP